MKKLIAAVAALAAFSVQADSLSVAATAVHSGVAPSRKSTVPVAVVPGLATVAVKVTDWPAVEGLA